MANELLKTLTIDGVSQDILEVGWYLKSNTDNEILLNEQDLDFEGSSQSIPNNSIGNYELGTIPKSGIYIARALITFPANANGVRFMAPIKIRNSTWTMMSGQRVSSASSGTTILSASIMSYFDEGNKIGMRLYQTSGSALTVSEWWVHGYLLKNYPTD